MWARFLEIWCNTYCVWSVYMPQYGSAKAEPAMCSNLTPPNKCLVNYSLALWSAIECTFSQDALECQH